jgi:hypothetical protein
LFGSGITLLLKVGVLGGSTGLVVRSLSGEFGAKALLIAVEKSRFEATLITGGGKKFVFMNCGKVVCTGSCCGLVSIASLDFLYALLGLLTLSPPSPSLGFTVRFLRGCGGLSLASPDLGLRLALLFPVSVLKNKY